MARGFDITLRPARAGDAAQLARVQVDAWRDAYVGILPDRSLVEMSDVRIAALWSRSLRREEPRQVILVAEWDSRVVGFCHGGPQRSQGRDGRRQRRMAEVYTFYVEPAFQGQGIGTSLLYGTVERLRGIGFASLYLLVLVGNAIGQRFYEHHGGKAGEEVPCVVMGTPVNEMAYHWDDLSALLASLGAAMSRDDA